MPGTAWFEAETPQQIDAAVSNSTALRCNASADANLGPLQYCIAFDVTTDHFLIYRRLEAWLHSF